MKKLYLLLPTIIFCFCFSISATTQLVCSKKPNEIAELDNQFIKNWERTCPYWWNSTAQEYIGKYQLKGGIRTVDNPTSPPSDKNPHISYLGINASYSDGMYWVNCLYQINNPAIEDIGQVLHMTTFMVANLCWPSGDSIVCM